MFGLRCDKCENEGCAVDEDNAKFRSPGGPRSPSRQKAETPAKFAK